MNGMRSQLSEFLQKGNIIGSMAGVTIAFSTGNMIRSFVNEIIFPFLYTLLKYKNLGEFAPINTSNLSKFGKEFITFLIVIFVTYLFVKYVMKYLFNIKEEEKKEEAKKK